MAPSDARPQAPPFSNPWALMSASWSLASLCPEPNELLQPTRTMPRVCRGPGPRQHTEPPFTPRPACWARWWRGAPGKRQGRGVDLMVLRMAVVSPRGWQGLHRGPQCPGAHLAPFMGTVPAHTGTRPSPWAGGGVVGRMSSIHSAADSAKVGSAHVDL